MKKFVLLLLVVVVLLSGCGVSKVGSPIDAAKFKKEYESLNGKTTEDKTIRTVNIPEENPMIYKKAKDIVKMMSRQKSFVVYFGFAECPWCRSIIENLISVSQEYGINKIYYVDIKDIRDTVKVTPLVGAETVKEGTEDYYALVDRLKDVLEDYTLEGENGETVITGLKRIYAPNIVVVVKGEPVAMTKGYPPTFEDPYMELDDEFKNYSKMLIGEAFEKISTKKKESKESLEEAVCTDKESC